ncbi:MAG: hypothetical protein JXB62_13260 [Pirellulales bacterium]|nr:hypothetical protein [Pirellulales bacterium]
MGALRLDRLLDFLTSVELVVGLLWAGLAVFTLTLLVLMRTRWGQSRPLRKCIVLSVLAHALLAGYATTVEIVAAKPSLEEPVLRVSFVEGPVERTLPTEAPLAEEKPWEKLVDDHVPLPAATEPAPHEPALPPEPQRRVRAEPSRLPGELPLDHLALSEAELPEPQPIDVEEPAGRSSPGKSAEEIEVPTPQRRESPLLALPDEPIPERPAAIAESPLTPVHAPDSSLPTELLQQDVPLPQLAAEATTPQPAESLAGLTDQLAHPMRIGSRDEASQEAGRSTSQDDAAQSGASDPSYSGSRQPWSPAIDSPDQTSSGPSEAESPPGDAAVIVIPGARRDGAAKTPAEVPKPYKLRVAPDRSRLAERRGATPATEAAVKAALRWLAENQSADGRWDASALGAGRESNVAGRNRQNAGVEADTGLTGLALLAFLASGHTHREGPYQENVRRGLVFLLRNQRVDGSLAGQATPYAKMYCHSMAAFALSEAYGMSADERLREPVGRAIDYTIAAQHPTLGGWRYLPGDPGDTSQCGWQVMALKSAELAGIPIPLATRNGAIRYLRSASSGTHGGLSSYRPGERASRPMTAEALVCWQFLGMPREHPASDEAGDYLLEQLPGEDRANLYYWYYGTLGMYQLQGAYWQRWNDALKAALLDSQQKTGPLAGSWDPNTVWGSYGGRVYSTSLAALCLEVYYRFLPLYADAAPKNDQAG